MTTSNKEIHNCRTTKTGQSVLIHKPIVSVLLHYSDDVKVVPLRHGFPLIVGRAPPATAVIDDAKLSRFHAKFTMDDEGVSVEDLGSTNGTKLNGDRIRRALIGESDEVTLGDVTATLHILKPTVREHPGNDETYSPIVVIDPKTRDLFRMVDKVSSSNAPVLILGETGTGKELVARSVHEKSQRHKKRLGVVNCGAIAESLVESTLFGHERGAFTGADRQRLGIFEHSDGGTVFLDEVGELSLTAQASLLRVFEAHEVLRVGAAEPVKVDVRIIAATNRNLEAMCKDGTFRLDLFYRLNTVVLEVPPLRKRLSELGGLCETFITETAKVLGTQIKQIDEGALKLLREYRWPGNVRELRNVIERAMVITDGPTITAEKLPRAIRKHTTVKGKETDDIEPYTFDFKSQIQDYEKRLIIKALKKAGGNQSKAAKMMQMSRRTLVHKIRSYNIRKNFGS